MEEKVQDCAYNPGVPSHHLLGDCDAVDDASSTSSHSQTPGRATGLRCFRFGIYHAVPDTCPYSPYSRG
jgi:hypothetical protein